LVNSVIEATVLLIEKRGWPGVTTEGVAELAGCSIGSLYQYFPNKESLLEELAERHIEEVQTIVSSFVAEISTATLTVGDLSEKLVTLIFDIHRENPTLHRLLSDQMELPIEIKERFERFLLVGQQWLAQWLSTNSNFGKDVAIVAQLVIGTIDHAAHRVLILQNDETVIEQTYTQTIRMIELYLNSPGIPNGAT
jgi:AcrR family transcriptional regulator